MNKMKMKVKKAIIIGMALLMGTGSIIGPALANIGNMPVEPANIEDISVTPDTVVNDMPLSTGSQIIYSVE